MATRLGPCSDRWASPLWLAQRREVKATGALCSAGGMSQAVSIAHLLEGSRDAATCILSLVPLRTLAAVTCTSAGLRAVVADQPVAMWRASLQARVCLCATASAGESFGVLQAAAGREHAAHHPALSVPSVCAYLQPQRATRAGIRSGTHAQRRVLRLEEPLCISPDCSKLAGLGPGARLHIQDLQGRPIGAWQLPEVSAAWKSPLHWGFDPSGRTLCLPYGGSNAAGNAGIIFMDTESVCSTLKSLHLV